MRARALTSWSTSLSPGSSGAPPRSSASTQPADQQSAAPSHVAAPYSASGARPPDVPGDPARAYADAGWAGWPDFLGYPSRMRRRAAAQEPPPPPQPLVFAAWTPGKATVPS